jgi:hypothetical protein
VFLVLLFFGYIAGSDRLLTGIFIGAALGSLRLTTTDKAQNRTCKIS